MVGAAVAFIAGNWKMFKGPAETARFCAELRGRIGATDGVRVAVCPPYVSLREAVDALAGTSVSVFAQNAHWHETGAYTGEVAPGMLREVGIAGTIVGHSERRQHFGDTDETVALRAATALDAGLEVIACVGGPADERENGWPGEVLRGRVNAIADAAGGARRRRTAHGPVRAIGTGRTATPEIARDAHAFIRSLLDVPILYGGSVKPDNAAELLAQRGIDGALVGGASLEV